ncbi:MAG TPA: NDP-sugar synthase, partial [Candidatus Bathyarchaeia archaeon]|nr:NDP-sugar synthase [Candidatus Bathyarchaeia archaeon]
GEERFFVANGDIVCDVDIEGMLAHHDRKNADATIAVVSSSDPSAYGSVLTDAAGLVTKFEEKPHRPSVNNLVNAGVYLLSAKVIDSIPRDRSVSLERDIFPGLAEKGKVQAWRHNGFWYDIGRIPDYIRANKELLRAQDDKPLPHSAGKLVKPVYLGANLRVGMATAIGPNTILSEDVTIGESAAVRNSIIFEETRIGDRVVVEDSIIGENVIIGKDSVIGARSIIAGQLNIPAGSLIPANSTLLC